MQVCVSSSADTCIYVWADGSQGSRPDLFLCCSMWLLGEKLTPGLKLTNCLDPLTIEHLRMLWPLFPSTGLRVSCLLLITHCGVHSTGQPVSVALYHQAAFSAHLASALKPTGLLITQLEDKVGWQVLWCLFRMLLCWDTVFILFLLKSSTLPKGFGASVFLGFAMPYAELLKTVALVLTQLTVTTNVNISAANSV